MAQSFQPHYCPGVDSASNRNEYQKFSGGGGGKTQPVGAYCWKPHRRLWAECLENVGPLPFLSTKN
jgi:hypothetical protein